jgi:hypothetical protein
MKFAELCRNVHTDDLLQCLLRALSELSDLMHNYYSIFKWHITKERGDDGLSQYDFSKVKESVDDFRQQFWARIQNKFSALLNNSDFARLKMDRFMQVFHALNMLCELGEEFSDSDSHQLRGSLRAVSISYFKNHHKDTLENLRMMMENESWQRLDSTCFSLSDVPQFDQSTNYRRNTSSERVDNYIKQVRMYLHSDDTDQNPFKLAFEHGHFQLSDPENDDHKNKHVDSSDSEDEDNDNSDSDDEEDEDIKQAQAQQKKKLVEQQKKQGGPVFANITMSMIKRMGTYVHALEVLQMINTEIFEAFTSLYTFYVYTVYSMFSDVQEGISTNEELRVVYPETDPSTPEQLKDFFKEVRSSLNKYNYDNFFAVARPSGAVQPQLKLSKKAYGFYERSVAAESLSFMQSAIATASQSRLVHLVPKAKVSLVDKFVNDMQQVTKQVQTAIYGRVARALFKNKYDEKVPKKLDIQNPQLSSNSAYVNDIVRDLAEFSRIMKPLEEHEHIPAVSTDMLWTLVIKGVAENVVEGLAKIKSCNDFGRALLQLDARSLAQKLSDIVPGSVRATTGQIPYIHLVRIYAEGTFNDSAQYMLEWVRDNKDNYTLEQVKNILQISPLVKLGRKERNELISQIDLMYRNAKTQASNIPRQSIDVTPLSRQSLDIPQQNKSLSPRNSVDGGPSTGTEPSTTGLKKSNSMWNGFSNLTNNLLHTNTNTQSQTTTGSTPLTRQSIDQTPKATTSSTDENTGGELKKSGSLWNKLNVGGNTLNINSLKFPGIGPNANK